MLKAGEGARDVSEVFVSYHEASAGELAQTIADKLEEAGISCWCARRDMPFGGDFARTIPGQIDACKVFLLLLNENAYRSDHIESEVGLAFSRRNKKRNLRILPVEIGDFTRRDWIEYYLIHTQSMKFPENPDARRIQELVNRIADLLPAKIVESGKCGDNVTYTLENGVLTISGTGPMWDFMWDIKTQARDTPWQNEREIIYHVEIQNGLTTIGCGAFEDCAGLASVTIPDSVTSIRMYTFLGCDKLTSVSVPAKANISPYVFSSHTCVIRRASPPR